MNKYILVGNAALVLTLCAGVHANELHIYQVVPNPPVFISNTLNSSSVTINVPDHGTIKDLNIGFLISHTWQGDLLIRLFHIQSGHTVTLVNRPGSPQFQSGFSANNFGNPGTRALFVLDDEATQGPYDIPAVASPGITNPTGNWRPENPLTLFDDEDMFGTWILNVIDFADGDVGTLNLMRLEIAVGPPPCPADVTGNGVVNIDDLLAVINAWGACPAPPATCPADIAPPGGNSTVNIDDLLAVINGWGACP